MPRRDRWKRPVRVVLGFAVGLALWLGLIGVYRSWLAIPAEGILRLTESPAVTTLRDHEDPSMTIVDREDFPPQSPRPVLRLRELTFNVIFLLALFGLVPLTDRNVAALAGSLAILWISHVAFMIVQVKRIYALQLGAWSEANYGSFARNLWGVLDQFYSVVGAFAIPFAAWWLLSRRDR